MNWIKDSLLVLIVSFACFGILIVGDWAIEKVLNGSFDKNTSSAALIEKERVEQEDFKYRKDALDKGFERTLWPELFDSRKSLSSEMRKLNIGAIGGVPNTKTYYCNEGYGLIKYTSDRFGLRNDDSKWDQANKVVFIGDSYIHGACVSDDNTLPSLYEKMSGNPTLNLGFGSNNPKHYATLAELMIPAVMPKTVFMVFYPNDKGNWSSTTFDLHVTNKIPFFRANENKLLPRAEYENLYDYARASDVENAVLVKGNFLSRLLDQAYTRITLPTLRKLGKNLLNSDSVLGDSELAINLAQSLCNAHDCELTVVYIPNSNYWRPDAGAENYRSLLHEYTKEININFIDSSKIFDRNEGSTDYAIKGAHLSPQGYAKLAKLLISDN